MNPPPTSGSLPFIVSPGARFGSYDILQRLGAGGMGEVYRAKDTRLGREVALKTILLNRLTGPDFLSRFRQEARVACLFNHPNIVTIFEFGEVNGTHYIAMELVRGETVRQMLAAGPIPFRRTADIAAQVAAALAEAHERGLIHRDLKPDNLMVSEDGTAKILDFGLAKLLGGNAPIPEGSTVAATLTEPGAVLGTAAYMSPEQVNGGSMDHRSDQFSFGALVYEMVTGRPAFVGKSQAEIMAAILRDDPDRLDSRTLQAPAPFFWIVERCLAKDPKQRYVSTRDLARDLAMVRDRLADAPAHHPERRCHNLPVPRTPMVGRERELAALRELLVQLGVRLITLTGPGGIGKTRLALQAADGMDEQFAGGVCFVALSAIGEQELIAVAIAQALGLRETGHQPAQKSVGEYIGALKEPMLLLLDNFEHLVCAAPCIAELLTLSSKLKVVVTSQAPLHVYGEHEFPVPPLALPNAEAALTLEVLSRLPAVALFVERARAVKHEFTLTKENAPAVAAICVRLDGLPLAIELAAARIKMLSPAAMLAKLERRLSLLTGGARDLPMRQQTLRGTVDWSYGLMNEAERVLLRRVAVFAGGCTLEAVEAVCNTQRDIGMDVIDGMASLVDKSLVQQVEQDGEDSRFAMLSTIREYAMERLVETGGDFTARRAHAAYYLVMAEEGDEEGAIDRNWLDRLEVEHDNLRCALEFLMETENAEWGLRLGAALFRFWESREYLTEGRNAMTRLLNLEGSLALPKFHARLLFDAAVLAGEQGDYSAAQELFEQSMKICTELLDDRGVAVALNALGVNARDRGELAAALRLFEQCVVLWRELGGPTDIARALSNLANVAKLQGDYSRALSLYAESLIIFKTAGDSCGAAWTLNCQGDLAREAADFKLTRSLYEQSLQAFHQLHDGWGIASALCDLGNLSRDERDYAEALRLYRESETMFRKLGHKRGIARVLECVAEANAARSNAELCLCLAGAAAVLRQRLGVPLTPAEQVRLEKILEVPRRALSSGESLSAWMRGWAMTMEQAVHEAFGSEN
jgi:predicted ATPase